MIVNLLNLYLSLIQERNYCSELLSVCHSSDYSQSHFKCVCMCRLCVLFDVWKEIAAVANCPCGLGLVEQIVMIVLQNAAA